MFTCILYVVLLDSASGTDLSDCSCPPRCTNFVYEATVSSLRLSDMMKNYYVIHGNNDSEIERHYVNAAETRNRVASSLISDIIGHLEKLVTAYQRLKAMLAIDLTDHTTSVPGQIHASVNTIVQKTQDSLAEFSSQIADKFTDYYEQNVDIFVTQLVRSAKSIVSYQFYLANIDMNDTESFNISRVEEIFDYKDEFCRDFNTVLTAASSGRNFSTKLSVDITCYSGELRSRYCNDSAALTKNDTDYIDELRGVTESTRKILKCLPMYRTFLSDVQSWLKLALTINSSLPLQPADGRYIPMELENELNYLNYISRTFATKSEVRSF